jgi:hypothetical protein
MGARVLSATNPLTVKYWALPEKMVKKLSRIAFGITKERLKGAFGYKIQLKFWQNPIESPFCFFTSVLFWRGVAA